MQYKQYLNDVFDQYMETVNESASDDVIGSRNKHHDSVGQYIDAVFEDAWKKGFVFALQIQDGKQ